MINQALFAAPVAQTPLGRPGQTHRSFSKNLKLCLVTFLALTLFACQKTPTELESAYVTGSVTYRERMALPDDAVVEVQLQDVSLADAPATILTAQRITSPGQVPIAFALAYDPASILESNRYALQARIEQDGHLLFISDTYTPVLTHGGGNQADILLVRTRQPTQTVEEAAGNGVELTGMFRYMADAAMFRDCRNGLSFPVSMEGAYIDAERAYMAVPHEAGAEVMMHLRGRYLERPPMEGDQNIVHLIVDRFDRIEEGVCEPQVKASLTDTWWRLTVVDGNNVSTLENQPESHMVLESAGNRVRGNGGCNGFFGEFTATGESIRFSAMGSTMMACPSGEETERAFLSALSQADRYVISGEVLELFAGDESLARFESVYH